jgi:katanin p80 WD40 repeat-containing subunit B1
LVPSTPQRVGVSSNNRSVIVPRTSSEGELATDSTSDAGDVALVLRKVTIRVDPASDSRKERNDVEPIIPRARSRLEIASNLMQLNRSKN